LTWRAKIGKFGIFRRNFPNPNPNQRWPTQPDPSTKKLTRPNLGQKLLIRTHYPSWFSLKSSLKIAFMPWNILNHQLWHLRSQSSALNHTAMATTLWFYKTFLNTKIPKPTFSFLNLLILNECNCACGIYKIYQKFIWKNKLIKMGM